MEKLDFITTTINKDLTKTIETFSLTIDKIINIEAGLKQQLRNIDVSSYETTDIFQQDKELKNRDKIDNIISWLHETNIIKKEITTLLKEATKKLNDKIGL